MTATEALRKCVALLKQVDFADCAESPELWHEHGLVLQEAEAFLKSLPLTDAEIDAVMFPPRAQLKAEDWDPATKQPRPRPVQVAPVLRDGEKQEPVAAEENLSMIEYIANKLETCINMQQVSEEEWQYATHIDARTAQMVQELRGSAKALRELIADISFMPPELKFLADQVDKAVALHNERCTAPQPAAAPSGDVERDAVLNEAVAALYFNDNSKYEGALWNIVHQLSPSIHQLLQSDPRAAYVAVKE